MTEQTQQQWVEVRDEPNHFHRYENDYARVYDVRFEPGQHSLYHRHDEDTLYVAVHATRVREQRLGESDHVEFDLPAGMSACRTHRSDPLIHVVENRGEGLMRMIGAEVKATPMVHAAYLPASRVTISGTTDHATYASPMLDYKPVRRCWGSGVSDSYRQACHQFEPDTTRGFCAVAGTTRRRTRLLSQNGIRLDIWNT